MTQMFRKNCTQWGDWPAVVSKDDETYSYKDYYGESMKFGLVGGRTRRFAKSLLKLGLKPHDVCAMIGFNSPEYYFSLQGTWMAGCVTAGIYTTNSPEACEYVLQHSEAKVCVCQSGKSAKKIISLRDSLPQLKAIVVYWPEEDMPTFEDKEGVGLVDSLSRRWRRCICGRTSRSWVPTSRSPRWTVASTRFSREAVRR